MSYSAHLSDCESGQCDSIDNMNSVEHDIPNIKVGRFLIENKDIERSSYQNTWSSGSRRGKTEQVFTT